MREKILSALASVTGQDASAFSDELVIKEIEGFDSLLFVMMLSQLQEMYHIEIPLDKAIEVETVGDLVASARMMD